MADKLDCHISLRVTKDMYGKVKEKSESMGVKPPEYVRNRLNLLFDDDVVATQVELYDGIRHELEALGKYLGCPANEHAIKTAIESMVTAEQAELGKVKNDSIEINKQFDIAFNSIKNIGRYLDVDTEDELGAIHNNIIDAINEWKNKNANLNIKLNEYENDIKSVFASLKMDFWGFDNWKKIVNGKINSLNSDLNVTIKERDDANEKANTLSNRSDVLTQIKKVVSGYLELFMENDEIDDEVDLVNIVTTIESMIKKLEQYSQNRKMHDMQEKVSHHRFGIPVNTLINASVFKLIWRRLRAIFTKKEKNEC